ncbi:MULTISPECIES: hypothetical protein [unclassified Rhizobium]|uniref:hypothetical protein n=1 Tax=unclassified Rhizobium TaxID=2613769 RepID=UPI001AE696A9|nr:MULTISPECIES: hypothetical protein [unclassified Rhizobium]MBP2459568.1 hypothetical protein [Rhizobium sp. PvP014]MBP2531862.1 hypothetical protein [Rhizobium sp. PvP099]
MFTRRLLYQFGFILIIAILAWRSWEVFSNYQNSQANERKDAAFYHANAAQHSVETCGAVMEKGGVFDWFTCLADSLSADGSEKQAEYDLKAQQDMSAWALGMLIVTIWMAAATFLGVFFVWKTLIATQEMASDTRSIGEVQNAANQSSLDVAAQSLAVSRRVAEAELTPGIVVESIKISIDSREISMQRAPTTFDGGLKELFFLGEAALEVRNWGKTPIFDFTICGRILLVDRNCAPLGFPEFDELPEALLVKSKWPLRYGLIPPGETVTITERHMACYYTRRDNLSISPSFGFSYAGDVTFRDILSNGSVANRNFVIDAHQSDRDANTKIFVQETRRG